MPVEVTLLSSSSTALTPTTAPARNNSSVVSGLSRLTPPSLSTSTSSFGTAPTSAFRPSCNACRGVSPGPTPPFFSPTIALCSWSWSPQNASLPNVSQRKIFLPSAMSCCEFSVTLSSHSSRSAACVRAAGSVSTSLGSERHAPAPTTNKAIDEAISGRAFIDRLLRKHTPSQSCRFGKVPPDLQGSRRFPLCLQHGTPTSHELRFSVIQNYSERIQPSHQDFQGAPTHLRRPTACRESTRRCPFSKLHSVHCSSRWPR